MFETNELNNEINNEYICVIGLPIRSEHLKLTVKGKNNTIIFKNSVTLIRTNISIVGDNNVFIIHDNCVLRGNFLLDKGAKIEIGSKTIFNFSTSAVEARDSKSITIGSNCLFSQARLQTSDVHSIFDLDTKKRINPPKDIVIENNVWIAFDALICKGSYISENSVVGARALVAGKFPVSSVIAGNPAKVIKSNIVWDTRSLDSLF